MSAVSTFTPWLVFAAVVILAFWIPKLPTAFRCLQRYQSSKPDQHLPLYVQFSYMCIREFASFWHRYEIHGLEHLDEGSRKNCVLVGYHSRPTVDIIYILAFLSPLSSLVSYIFFSIPFAAGMLRASNCIPSSTTTQSSDQTFVAAVVGGDMPLLLLPGGAHECVKRWDQRYRLDWKARPGFMRVLFGTPAAETEKETITETGLNSDSLTVSVPSQSAPSSSAVATAPVTTAVTTMSRRRKAQQPSPEPSRQQPSPEPSRQSPSPASLRRCHSSSHRNGNSRSSSPAPQSTTVAAVTRVNRGVNGTNSISKNLRSQSPSQSRSRSRSRSTSRLTPGAEAKARMSPVTARKGKRVRVRVVGEETKIVPFFTHNCEEIYWNPPWLFDWTSWAMRAILSALKSRNGSMVFKTALMPVVTPVLALALGFVLLPQPVKLDLYVGRPLSIRPGESEAVFTRRVKAAVQGLMDTAISKHRQARKQKQQQKQNEKQERHMRNHGHHNGSHDYAGSVSTATEAEMEEEEIDWRRVGRYPIYVLYAVLQNLCIFAVLGATVLLPFAVVLLPVWFYAADIYLFLKGIGQYAVVVVATATAVNTAFSPH